MFTFPRLGGWIRVSETHLQVTHPVRTLGLEVRLGLLSDISGVPGISDGSFLRRFCGRNISADFETREDGYTVHRHLEAELDNKSNNRGRSHGVRDLFQEILT